MHLRFRRRQTRRGPPLRFRAGGLVTGAGGGTREGRREQAAARTTRPPHAGGCGTGVRAGPGSLAGAGSHRPALAGRRQGGSGPRAPPWSQSLRRPGAVCPQRARALEEGALAVRGGPAAPPGCGRLPRASCGPGGTPPCSRAQRCRGADVAAPQPCLHPPLSHPSAREGKPPNQPQTGAAGRVHSLPGGPGSRPPHDCWAPLVGLTRRCMVHAAQSWPRGHPASTVSSCDLVVRGTYVSLCRHKARRRQSRPGSTARPGPGREPAPSQQPGVSCGPAASGRPVGGLRGHATQILLEGSWA